MSTVVGNFVIFQLGWFACVLGGAGRWHWAGTLAVAAIVAFHLSRAREPRKELSLVLAAVLIGTCWDSLLVTGGLVRYTNGVMHESLAPHWIMAMWALFATTLNVSLRWLKGRTALAALFGALGGPLAYYAGHRLGAVEMPDMANALTALAVGWAFLMPVLMHLSMRLNGFHFPESRYQAQ